MQYGEMSNLSEKLRVEILIFLLTLLATRERQVESRVVLKMKSDQNELIQKGPSQTITQFSSLTMCLRNLKRVF